MSLMFLGTDVLELEVWVDEEEASRRVHYVKAAHKNVVKLSLCVISYQFRSPPSTNGDSKRDRILILAVIHVDYDQEHLES